jgi:hypothetical protein
VDFGIDVPVVTSAVSDTVDDGGDEVSVELETLFIVVVSILVINEDATVSIEVTYGCDIVDDDDDDEYGTEIVLSSIVLSLFPVVELEVSYVLEIN